jgi:hypothetical protein
VRIRPQPAREQRKELRVALARLQRPEAALAVVRPCLDRADEPAGVTCDLQSVHPDRFVMKVVVRPGAGRERAFALKVYSDDFGAQMWSLARALAADDRPDRDGLCLPRHFAPLEHALVYPWVDGTRMSEIVDERKPELLRRAARLAGGIHRTRLAGLPSLTPDMVVADTLDRCGRLRYRWPSTESSVRFLAALLHEAVAALDPARPAVVHGDLAAGQFVWTGDRLVLLDLDTAAMADPAYDVGHFLGQVERRCVLDPTLPAHAAGWLSCIRDAYPAVALGISWRNVSFYQGVTLIRKMYTLARRDPVAGPRLAYRLADRARAALENAVPARQVG